MGASITKGEVMDDNKFALCVRERGTIWAISSCKIIAAYVSQAMQWENKAAMYPEKDFYYAQDTRKTFIEKRNECLNCALCEIRSWNTILDNCLVQVPRDLRPWQENCSEVKSAIKAFLLLEKNAVHHGLYKVG